MKRIKLPDTHAEWLKMRRYGIGGSDAGAIAGLSPYKSPFAVYCDKIGLIESDQEDNEAMRVGRDLEEYVARRFCEATGKKVRKSSYMYKSDEHPFMLANIDRFIVGENAFLECKTSNAFNADNFTKADIPAYHYAQLCHYMSVGFFEKCYYAVLVMGIKFVWLEFTYDEMQDDIDALVRIEKDFWENNICSCNAPEIDGTDSTKNSLGRLFKETIPLEQAAISTDLLEKRAEIKAKQKELKAELDQIENEIKLEFASAELGINDEWNVSYKQSVRKGSLDTDKMIADGIDIENYRKPETVLRILKATKKRK